MSDLPVMGISSNKAGRVLLYPSSCTFIATPCLSDLSHILDSNARRSKDETRYCNES
jgi:hypothetical protein